MNKKIIKLTACVLSIIMLCTFGTFASAQTYKNGDVNKDGQINLLDVTIIARYVAGWPGYSEIIDAVPDEPEVSSDPTLKVGKVNASAGDLNVALPIEVANNPGILSMLFTVNYDESALELVSAENGAAVSSVLTLTKPGEFKNGCNFFWDGQEVGASDIKDGTVLTLYFNVKDTASSGAHNVTISYTDGDIVNADLAPVAFKIENGSVTVG